MIIGKGWVNRKINTVDYIRVYTMSVEGSHIYPVPPNESIMGEEL